MGRWKEPKRPRSLTAISLGLGAVILALFLVCMTLLTLGTAQYIFRELVDQGRGLAKYVHMAGMFDTLYSKDASEERRQIPGIVDYSMNHAIDLGRISVGPPSYSGYPGPVSAKPLNIFRDDTVQCETVVLFLNRDGQIVRQSGDFVYFWYMSEEDWRSESDVASGAGWIDLGDGTDERYAVLRTTYAGTHSLFDYPILRLTGYFDGARFEPLAMALMTNAAVYQAVDRLLPPMEDTYEYEISYTYSGLDAMGFIEWDVCFDFTNEAEPGRELVTIYAEGPQMSAYEPEGPVRDREGREHESLPALLSAMDFYIDQEWNYALGNESRWDLWDLVVFSSWMICDDTVDTGQPAPQELGIVTAMRASPLRIAMGFLRNVYLAAFALALAGFLLIRSSIKTHLIKPLEEIQEGAASGWAHLANLSENPPSWEEPYALAEQYAETRNTLRIRKNEIERLNTALRYAEDAERNRRQMTSSIAHELKTPLAVIHSYAEGLKEHIAEDKRDHYIDVILSEVERTDAMVLELLDLSRLEAGKVKLSRDDFSLMALTRSIFEKLERAAQAKGLQIEYSFPEEFTITADEGRIAQVIENFATNAIKYTPPGGHILVRIEKGRAGASFAIENESEPLPWEALGRVWDTFYRRDEARTGGGTGLGLAIAKSIVELHGGRCSVRNTKGGVEFGFTI